MSSKPIVLVVDDEIDIRTVLRAALQHLKCEVLEAANGQQALEACRKTAISLMITDLVMPAMEGIEMILTLRKEFPALPIIAISGGDRGSLNAARHLGATIVLEKPLELSELSQAVRGILQLP